MDQLKEFKRVSKAVVKGKEAEDTVTYQNSRVIDISYRLLKENKEVVLLGIKNTSQIEREILDKLTADDSNIVFHTVDKMARQGRAVDVDLVNPLTGRLMTGSSSGGCVNILRGINDLAVGTDGGGSVLGPALAANLFSIMAKGIGLKGKKKKKSTDEISFLPGIGFISHDFDLCIKALRKVLAINRQLPEVRKNLTIGVPKGEAVLPHGEKMDEVLKPILNSQLLSEFKLVPIKIAGCEKRRRALKVLESAFEAGVDIVLTAEGPIDQYGYGDSVMGQWKVGAKSQKKSGKYLIRAANMVDATAVTFPTDRLGTGVITIARPGLEMGLQAVSLVRKLTSLYNRPKLYNNYFIDQFEKIDDCFFRGGK